MGDVRSTLHPHPVILGPGISPTAHRDSAQASAWLFRHSGVRDLRRLPHGEEDTSSFRHGLAYVEMRVAVVLYFISHTHMRSRQILRLVMSTKFILHLFWHKFGINVVLAARPARSRRWPPPPAKLKRLREKCSWPADAVLVKSEYLKGIEWGEYVDRKRKRGGRLLYAFSCRPVCPQSCPPVRYSVHTLSLPSPYLALESAALARDAA